MMQTLFHETQRPLCWGTALAEQDAKRGFRQAYRESQETGEVRPRRTPLQRAAMCRLPEGAAAQGTRLLLAAGADASAKAGGSTALLCAADDGPDDPTLAGLLLSAGCDLGRKELELAKERRPRIAALLQAAKASPEATLAPFRAEVAALEKLVAQLGDLEKALAVVESDEERLAAVRKIEPEYDAMLKSVLGRIEEEVVSNLTGSAKHGRTNELAKGLIAKQAMGNLGEAMAERPRQGLCCLDHASMCKDPEAAVQVTTPPLAVLDALSISSVSFHVLQGVRLLIAAGADAAAMTSAGRNALHLAAKDGPDEAILAGLLIAAGCDPTLKETIDGNTALDVRTTQAQTSIHSEAWMLWTCVLWACALVTF